MKTRGQISLDLIVTVVAVLLITTTIMAFIPGFQANQEKISLDNQLKQTAAKVSSFITATGAMQGTSFDTKLQLDKIKYYKDGQPAEMYPLIDFDWAHSSITIKTDPTDPLQAYAEPCWIPTVAPAYTAIYSSSTGILEVKNK